MRSSLLALALLACTSEGEDSDSDDTDSGSVVDTCEDSVLFHLDWVQTYTYTQDGRPSLYGEDVDQDGVANTAIAWDWTSDDDVTLDLSYDGEPWWVDTVHFDDGLPTSLDHQDDNEEWQTAWTWDADDRLTSVVDEAASNTWTRTFTYDGDGNVVEDTDGVSDYLIVTTWTWDGGAPVLEEVDNGDDGSIDEVTAMSWTFADGHPVAMDEDEGDDGTVDAHTDFVWDGDLLLSRAWSTTEDGLCLEHVWTYTADGRVATATSTGHCGDESWTEFAEYTYGCEGTVYARPSPFPDFWHEDLGEVLDLARRAEAF